jgi:hypothetical protein
MIQTIAMCPSQPPVDQGSTSLSAKTESRITQSLNGVGTAITANVLPLCDLHTHSDTGNSIQRLLLQSKITYSYTNPKTLSIRSKQSLNVQSNHQS